MSFSMYQLLVDHREGLVAQLSKALGRVHQPMRRCRKHGFEKKWGICLMVSWITSLPVTLGRWSLLLLYLVRRTGQNLELADVVMGLLTVPVVLRQFLQAAYREQVVGGGRAAYEQTITEVEEGCHKAVRRFCELYEEHVKEKVHYSQ